MEDSSDILSVVFNYPKVLEYFSEFYNLLQNTNHEPDFKEFSKYLQFIVKYDSFRNDSKFYTILHQIFDSLCLKYFNNTHYCDSDIKFDKTTNVTLLFDAVSLMIKILILKFNDKVSLTSLFHFIATNFRECNNNFKITSCEFDLEKQHVRHFLKFFVDILLSLNSAGMTIHVSPEVLTPIMQYFPFYSKFALQMYVNQVVPTLFSGCSYDLKKLILESMWQKIVTCYEEDFYLFTELSLNLLLCCFSDYMFQECYELKNFSLHNDTIWRIIQSNLSLDSSYNRKQALYVFKLILFWIKSNNYVSPVSVLIKNVPIFAVTKIEDLLIWNDLIILFESLEEKQIHVIKPILPKLSRILLQASKKCDKNSFILHPSWITCLLKRMIFHESKFIKKQGLAIGININFKESLILELHSKEFIKLIIDGFNDQNMYCRVNENDNFSLYLSSEKIVNFLTSYIEAFETELQKANCLRYLLELIASNSWCGVALMHMIFALTNLKSLPSWINDDIIYIRKIIQGCVKTHEALIRKAIEYWLLKSCILFVNWKSMTFEDIAELLINFKTFERHTVIWNEYVLKLKEIISVELSGSLSLSKAEEFAISSVNNIVTVTVGKVRSSRNDLQKLAVLLVLLADSCVISCNSEKNSLNWSYLLHPVTSTLMDAPKRPYLSEDKFYNALEFYTCVLDTAVDKKRDINEEHSFAILNCLNCIIEFLEFTLHKSLMDIKGSDDIISFQVLFDSLEIFASVNSLSEIFTNLLPSFLNNYDHIPSQILSKKIIIILLFEFSNNQFHDQKFSTSELDTFKELTFNFLSKIISEHVVNDLLKTIFVNEMEREVWLKLTVLSVNKFWQTASSVANFLSYSDHKDLILSLIQLAEDSFDGGSKATYSSMIDCIRVLMPKLGLSNISIIEKLLSRSYKACSELQGCEAYRPALESFVKTVFQPFMIEERYFDILYNYINCFKSISENSLGIFYLVIRQFCDTFPITLLYKKNFNFITFLVYSVTYGPIHQKSQKTLEDNITSISDQDKYFSGELKNYNKPSVFVRVTAVVYLLKNLFKNSSENEEIALKIIDALLSFDKSVKVSRSSTFANSFNHRIRYRIWQCILLLQPNILSESEIINFLEKILDVLELENQQPSIRYLQEWLVIKCIYLNKPLVGNFISVLEKSLEKRPGYLVSLLSILIHLIIHDFLLSSDQIFKCFPLLINYCMAQNFSVRLYSRLALTKLFAACEKNKLTSFLQKYDFLNDLSLPQETTDNLFEKGNIYKNLIKLQEEFYFAAFHPIKHFTLETIFFELPRLSNIAPEEWIKAVYFENILSSDFKLIPCFNTDDSLKCDNSVSWNTKSIDEQMVENNTYDYNFQKKICPVKSEIYDCIPEIAFETKAKQNNLIVIASLIDKIPNLGGLCRTCEIFGVEQFIIGSLKYTEDKTFQNLAVSSDRWVSIKEVKPYHLKEYLLLLKAEGYTLIGAEQTDDSYKLSNYIFPKKSALILGHEKEGMPVNLIQILDACVEIPQQGIIRSLNVHVSGAIFIWEYTRQQIKC